MGLSASRILLLLLMLIPGNLNFHISRRQEDAKKNVKKMVPSCADLLNMWQQMNRMTRHSLATNEIPMFPRNFFGLLLGISQTYPKTYNRHPGRTAQASHFKDLKHREHILQDEWLYPSQDPDLLKVGFSDPAENAFVNQREFLHLPKSKQRIVFDPETNKKYSFQKVPDSFQMVPQSPHLPIQEFQTQQRVVPDSKDKPEKSSDMSPTYERAFPLNEPVETSGLFGTFDDPFSAGGFAPVSVDGGIPQKSHAFSIPPNKHHQTMQTQIDPDHRRKDSVFTGFREQGPNTRLEDEVMDMFGTVLHDTEEEEKWNQEGKQSKVSDPLSQWMSADDLGSFGSFASDSSDEFSDDSLPEFQESIRPDKDPQGTSEFELQQPYLIPSEERILRKMSCMERRDGMCSSDVHCTCTGWMTLRCEMGRCRRQDTLEVSDGFDLGTWHDGPLSFSELGMNRVRRRFVKNPWTPM